MQPARSASVLSAHGSAQRTAPRSAPHRAAHRTAQRTAPRKCNQPAAHRSAHGSAQRSTPRTGKTAVHALRFCLCLFGIIFNSRKIRVPFPQKTWDWVFGHKSWLI
jgi:hypothetical protein